MNKFISLGVVLATVTFITACGADPLAQNGNQELPPASSTENSDGLLLNAGDIIASEVEARKQREVYGQDVQKATKLLEEAMQMDAGSQQEDIRARLAEVRTIAENLSNNDDFFVVAEDLKSGITDVEKKMASFVAVAPLAVYLDAGAKFSDPSIKAFGRQGADIYAVGEKGVYGPLQSNNGESAKAFAFPEGKVGIAASYALKFSSMYIATNPAGMLAFSGNGFVEQTIQNGQPWVPASQFTSFSSSLYVLDALSNKLKRYESTGKGTFGTPTDAIPVNATAGMAVTGLAIDGNIYLAAFGQSIKKFTRGEPQELSLDRDYKVSNLTTRLYTDVNSKYLYLFDSENKKLLQYVKGSSNLSINKEFTLDKTYTNFFVLPGDREVYLSEGNKVYKLAL